MVVAVAIGFYVLRWLDNNQREKKQKLLYEKAKLSDEAVTKAQMAFEKRLHENTDLPDGIRWQDAFIYWNCMRKWFGILIAAYRYDEKTSDKIKSDWLEYMYLMEDKATFHSLSLETEVEKKRDAYAKEAVEARSKKELIENAFAATIGKKAIEQLEYARSRPHDAFDRSGKKPIAPIGYHYFPTSIRPYNEELVADSAKPATQERTRRNF
jgi:hypothetical protein